MAERVEVEGKKARSDSPPEGVVIEPGALARNFWLLQRAFVAAYEDNCFSIAKGAAYSFLLSLFPVLTTLTAILIGIKAQPIVNVIAGFLGEVVPPGAAELVVSRLSGRGRGHISLPIFAIALSLWAGSGAMISLMEGFQAAYRIPSGRPFFQQRAMAIFLVIVAAVPAVAASALILFGNRWEAAFVYWVGVEEMSRPVELAWRFARYLLAFCTTTFVTGLLYYFGPNHRPEPKGLNALRSKSRFMRVWPGAFLATGLWLLATEGFAWYVSRANYATFYGSMGTVVILLIWLYLIACIALLGCEFNAESERVECIAALH
jgi:membrane protein